MPSSSVCRQYVASPSGRNSRCPGATRSRALVILIKTYSSVQPAKAELFFDGASKPLKHKDGLIGVVDPQRLWMNLVHGHVKMLVLLLAMANRDVLVFLEPGRPHGPADNALEFRRAQAPVLRVKRDDEMVGLVALRPQIAFLQQLHDVDGKLSVLTAIEAGEVPGHVPSAPLLALSTQHVRDKL